jgi:nucleotide-binding universal stress UspA family protein
VEAAGTDPIVMTTRGRSGVARAFLGSVTDKVVRAAAGPVLVIPPAAVERASREA